MEGTAYRRKAELDELDLCAPCEYPSTPLTVFPDSTKRLTHAASAPGQRKDSTSGAVRQNLPPPVTELLMWIDGGGGDGLDWIGVELPVCVVYNHPAGQEIVQISVRMRGRGDFIDYVDAETASSSLFLSFNTRGSTDSLWYSSDLKHMRDTMKEAIPMYSSTTYFMHLHP